MTNVPPLVLAILRQASEETLNPETTGIEPHETEAWLTAFARGVQYTHDTYGHIMGGIGIFNSVTNDQGQENRCLIMYDATNDFAVITRGFIERQIKTTRGLGAIFGNSNTGDRYEFTGFELATLLGVEEAYHAYQFKVLANQYSEADKISGTKFIDADKDNDQSRDQHYASNAIERDAAKVVVEAAEHFGFGRSKIANDQVPSSDLSTKKLAPQIS